MSDVGEGTMKFLEWLRGITGNPIKALILVVVFIAVLCLALCRPVKAAEVDLRLGASYHGGQTGPVAGLNAIFPQGQFDLYAGALLWGRAGPTPNNWSWEAGIRGCRWSICASFGGAYLQNIDRLNGSHTNFNLELAYVFGWSRVKSIAITHLSNGGTVDPNPGRNAALVNLRLQ